MIRVDVEELERTAAAPSGTYDVLHLTQQSFLLIELFVADVWPDMDGCTWMHARGLSGNRPLLEIPLRTAVLLPLECVQRS